MFLKCKSLSDSSLRVTPTWMLVLLKSYSEMSVGLQLELSGKLLVHLVWLLKLYCFFQGIKGSAQYCWYFLYGKNVWVLRKLNFSPEKIHSWSKNYVSLNLLSILLLIIIGNQPWASWNRSDFPLVWGFILFVLGVLFICLFFGFCGKLLENLQDGLQSVGNFQFTSAFSMVIIRWSWTNTTQSVTIYDLGYNAASHTHWS